MLITKLGNGEEGYREERAKRRLRGLEDEHFHKLVDRMPPASPVFLKDLAQPRPGDQVPAASMATPALAGQTNRTTSGSSPPPAGRPSLCPSPGSVFIINISLFRSLGFS